MKKPKVRQVRKVKSAKKAEIGFNLAFTITFTAMMVAIIIFAFLNG